jgi:hypothetical protein
LEVKVDKVVAPVYAMSAQVFGVRTF